MKTWRWQPVCSLVALTLAGASACDQRSDAPTPGAAGDTPVGEIVAVGAVGRTPQYEMSASVAEDCEVPVLERRASTARVGVEVTILARTKAPVPANPYYALLIDGNRRVHEPTLSGCEPSLEARLLTAGESARGWISFDVPKGSRNLTLAYLPRLENGDSEELLFALGR